MGKCLTLTKFTLDQWINHKAHLLIAYEKVSTPYAGIFSGMLHSFLLSKLADKPNHHQKVAGGHEIRVRRVTCRILWLVSHLHCRDRLAKQATTSSGWTGPGDTSIGSYSDSLFPRPTLSTLSPSLNIGLP